MCSSGTPKMGYELPNNFPISRIFDVRSGIIRRSFGDHPAFIRGSYGVRTDFIRRSDVLYDTKCYQKCRTATSVGQKHRHKSVLLPSNGTDKLPSTCRRLSHNLALLRSSANCAVSSAITERPHENDKLATSDKFSYSAAGLAERKLNVRTTKMVRLEMPFPMGLL